jgi:hypothetical protein
MSLEMGQQARLIQPVVEGEIIDTEYDKDAKQLKHLVAYTDADGESQTRWFLESQLEEVA